MENDDYDYFTMSVKESMSLIFWTAFISVSAVGLLLLAALQCLIIRQKGNTMTEQPPVGYVTSTTLDDGEVVIYGVFETVDKALEFGSKLINCVAYPIYPPSLH